MCCLIFAYAQLFSTSSCQCEHPVKPRTVLRNGHLTNWWFTTHDNW